MVKLRIPFCLCFIFHFNAVCLTVVLFETSSKCLWLRVFYVISFGHFTTMVCTSLREKRVELIGPVKTSHLQSWILS
jgi:hypothetical protein